MDEDGAVRVLDAHCPHLGAHLASAAKSMDNCVAVSISRAGAIGTGECVEIPYAKKIPPKAQSDRWPVREVNGVILVHHDPGGDAPDIRDSGHPRIWNGRVVAVVASSYQSRRTRARSSRTSPTSAHFPSVHGTEIDEFAFEVDGYTATQRVKGRAFLPAAASTTSRRRTTYHGPGYLMMRMDGALQELYVVAHTPVDENVSICVWR